MTIKRRLHITNVLVLVIPITMALLMNGVIFLISPYEMGKYQYETLNAHIIIVGLLSPLVVAITIPLTNMFLTRFVIKKITDPIDMLSYGVHQIRDGNLSYRIEYAGNDEFTSICADFNEMAWRLNEMVMEQQKDEANRKELIAGISHDLRTPLTSIKAYVEGLEKGVASTPETQRSYLDTIGTKTAEMEHIINQLFLFSKLDLEGFPLILERVDLSLTLQTLVGDIAEEYQEKGLSIALGVTQDTIEVDIDRQQFRNALINVIENSLKYKVKEQGALVISCSTTDSYATISLTDDGPGVPEDTLDKLFNVFYRVDASRSSKEGSGLGLAITAKMLEAMGGQVQAQNVAEGGLSILINLPSKKGAVA